MSFSWNENEIFKEQINQLIIHLNDKIKTVINFQAYINNMKITTTI